MKRLILTFWLLSFFTPVTSQAEIKVVTHTVQQPFGGSQSPDDARIAGIARAKREALERFGTYIESRTVVKDSAVDSDEIMALTAGVVRGEVVRQSNYLDGDSFGLEITVKMELDTDILDKSLQRLLEDRNHLKELQKARQREKELLARIAELEQQNKQKSLTAEKQSELKHEFQKASKGLTEIEKMIEEWQTDEINRILKGIFQIPAVPKDSAAYFKRGVSFAKQGKHQQAIADYTEAIKLEPRYSTVYFYRGKSYSEIKQYQHAVTDYTKAISIDKNNDSFFYYRGLAYSYLNQDQKAVDDFSQAIRLQPDSYSNYASRGDSYRKLKQYQQAIDDYTAAIRLDPTFPLYFNSRGETWLAVGTPSAIQQGCNDLAKSCSLGYCKGYEEAKQKGICR